ncbi:hypothetical protein [Maritalea mediterranea]|uniref:Uncharacterized protein n=1 Tax=Maritalea mediterranea TaxID=2909667 RepID=A0ABS9EA70_9HYPH|nr:hypothetical protein [Maritalea mediterranea]MCF4099784.1 hypothetical protein [Maritalea mediterranea]
MANTLPRRLSKNLMELLYLIGSDVEPYEIYIRSAMSLGRQRKVLARLQRRFGFQSVSDVKAFYKLYAVEIYTRLQQLDSFAIDPCGGPLRRDGHPELTQQDLKDMAVILRKLSHAGAK